MSHPRNAFVSGTHRLSWNKESLDLTDADTGAASGIPCPGNGLLHPSVSLLAWVGHSQVPVPAWCYGEPTVPAVVCPVRLDAAALGALVHHLPRLQLKALDELFSGISFGYRPLRGQ